MELFRNTRPRFNSLTLALATIAAITVILFRDFLFQGYVLDGIYDRRNNVLPYYFIFIKAFQNYEIPQWNSYLFCGNSLFTNSTYVYFYPPNWIVWAASPSAMPFVSTLTIMLHFVAAGYFVWCLLRAITNDVFWSICGVMSYLLSSASMLSISSLEQFLVFVYGPALLYLIYTLQERRLVVSFILLTVTAALLLLGGQIQFVFYGMGLLCAFTLASAFVRDGGTKRDAWISVLLPLGSILLAVMISAVRYVPFYLANSGNILNKQSYSEFLRINRSPLESIVKLFLPEYFLFMNKGEAFNAFAGVSTAFLGLYALFFLWNRKTWFWNAVIIAITLMVMGTPLAYAHYYLTGRSNLSFGRMATFLPLCFAVLMGVTGKLCLEDKRHTRRFIVFSIGMFFMVLIGAALLYLTYPRIPDAAADNEMRLVMMESLVFFSVVALPMIGLFVYFAQSQSEKRTVVFKAAFIFILAVDLLVVAMIDFNSQNPSFTPTPFYRSSLMERKIADQLLWSGRNFRILGMGEGTSHNRSISLGLYNSSGFESVPPLSVTRLYSYPVDVTRENAREIKPMNQRALELSSTRYVIVPEGVYEVPESLPRYSLYYDYAVREQERDALPLILGMSGGLDIHRTVVLDRESSIPVRAAALPGTVALADEGVNSVAFRVSTPENAVLLLNDTFDEGWTADIDGREAPVLRANFAFRGVAVPAGDHRVTFTYRQKGLAAAMAVSLASLGAFGILAASPLWRRRRRVPGE